MSRRTSRCAWLLLALSLHQIIYEYIATAGLDVTSGATTSLGRMPSASSALSSRDENATTTPHPIPHSLSRLRTFDETKLPYQCGVIFFYHIACTGGSSTNKWLISEEIVNRNVAYWTKWGIRRAGGVEDEFIEGVDARVGDVGPRNWTIVHAHGGSLFLNASERHLYRWREEVEGRGCAFVMTTVLREAVGHTISQTKGMVNPNYTLDEFLYHLEPGNRNRRGLFVTQIDDLLYNTGPRNVHNATREEKVRRAMELLRRHFDVVLVDDLDRYRDIILKITGWKKAIYYRSNTFRGELNFTERELIKIRRLTEANGDVMFIDAVKHVYYGYLDYLLA